jgi:DNA-binding response OmpR family regulator
MTRPLARPRCRILIADDNRDAAQALEILLQIEGFETATAFDGLEAVEIADQFRPKILILDISMPGLSGYEVARRVRRFNWAANSKIVALTAWSDDLARANAKRSGFDSFLVKPFDPATFVQRLETVLQEHR